MRSRAVRRNGTGGGSNAASAFGRSVRRNYSAVDRGALLRGGTNGVVQSRNAELRRITSYDPRWGVASLRCTEQVTVYAVVHMGRVFGRLLRHSRCVATVRRWRMRERGIGVLRRSQVRCNGIAIVRVRYRQSFEGTEHDTRRSEERPEAPPPGHARASCTAHVNSRV